MYPRFLLLLVNENFLNAGRFLALIGRQPRRVPEQVLLGLRLADEGVLADEPAARGRREDRVRVVLAIPGPVHQHPADLRLAAAAERPKYAYRDITP